MDKALDEIIGERRRDTRPRGPRSGAPRDSRRAPPRDQDLGPRDGIRKQYQRDGPRNLEKDWVHDRWNDDDDYRRAPRRDNRPYEPSPERRRESSDAKLRVDNIHFEILEPDLRELFGRMGPLSSVQLLYDRQDRATGTAFVTYFHAADAAEAVREFDGANAYGQPIRVRLLPPLRDEKPGRSLFDRIETADQPRRRPRSLSPDPRDIDRYVPGERGREGRRERSPRRGAPRERGRRPGERGGTRGGRGGRRTDGDGRPLVGGRPKKTAEELDAEMNDYWNSGEQDKGTDAAPAPKPAAKAAVPEADIDIMVE